VVRSISVERNVGGKINVDNINRTGIDTDKKEIMILWLGPQIFEDGLLPVSLHVVPIVDHAVANGVVHAVPWRLSVRERFIADEEIKILNTAFRREMAWFEGYGGCS